MQYKVRLYEKENAEPELSYLKLYIDAVKGSNLNKNFKDWFGKSEVVNDDGSPQIVYHGTRGLWKPADRFVASLRNDIGIHLGNIKQSNRIVIPSFKRNKEIDLENDFYKFMRILPCYLRIESPLDLEDTVTWDINSMAQYLIDLWIMPEEEVYKLTKEFNSCYYGKENKPKDADKKLKKIKDRMIESLEDAGYDGIRYENQTEGEGYSYMIFRPNQAKSIFNKGTWGNNTENLNEKMN